VKAKLPAWPLWPERVSPTIDAKLAPYGVFLLRVSLGAMFVSHALLKSLVFTMPGFAGFWQRSGFRLRLPGRSSWPS